MKSAFITAARRTVLLADHSKFNSAHFAHVADLSQIDVIITDSALSDDAATELETAGPTVIRA